MNAFTLSPDLGRSRPSAGMAIWLWSMLLNAAWVGFVFASMSNADLYVYFNSDTLYLPSIFRDVFVDQSGFAGWHLNAAPNFFPDMLSYFVVNALVSDFKLAMGVYSLGQYLVLLLLMGLVLRQIGPRIPWSYPATGNLMMLSFLLVSAPTGDFVFTFYVLSISYHLGPFLMTLGALILTLRYLREAKNRDLWWISLIVLLGVFSSRFFIVMFALPSLALIPLMLERACRKRILRFYLVLALGVLAGITAFNLLKSSGVIHIIPTTGKIFRFDNMGGSLQVMTAQHLGYIRAGGFRSLILLLSAASFLVTAGIAVHYLKKLAGRQGLRRTRSAEAFYVFFFCLFFLIVLFTPIVNGSYVGPAIMRYNVHVLYLGMFNLAFLMHYFLRNSRAGHVFNLPAGAALLLLTALTIRHPLQQEVGQGLKKFAQYYPDYVECTDRLAMEQGFRYGVGEYWYAKKITMFSKAGVRVYTVHHDMAIWYHVMNRNWYHAGGRGRHADPEFRFVIANNLDEVAILKQLGPPLNSYQCLEYFRVYEYPRFAFDDPSTRRPSFVPDP